MHNTAIYTLLLGDVNSVVFAMATSQTAEAEGL